MMVSKVLNRLTISKDPVEFALGKVLAHWQDAKASRGERASLGYEPKDFNRLGAIGLISDRVGKRSRGFADVDPSQSYEAIVAKYPKKFTSKIVAIAQNRLDVARNASNPTADLSELDARVAVLLGQPIINIPAGQPKPKKLTAAHGIFIRDPKVKAYILKTAKGRCELCLTKAPFNDKYQQPYLELHHVKPLANRGSDTITNSVALCPNCHRKIHHSDETKKLCKILYRDIKRLKKE